MNFSNNGIEPRCECIHGGTSINSKGVTSSGSLYPLAARKPRMSRNFVGLTICVQFHVSMDIDFVLSRAGGTAQNPNKQEQARAFAPAVPPAHRVRNASQACYDPGERATLRRVTLR
jgi:hypothetical protein